MRKRIIIVMLLSVLLHMIGGWQIVRVFDHYAQKEWEREQTEFASQITDVVFLTVPANDIKPQRANKIGVVDNATRQETVAPRRDPITGGGGDALRTVRKPIVPDGAGDMPEPVKRALRPAPATAITRQLGAGPSNHVPEDYLRNYRHGEHTYVNVLRHPGVSYFVEIKQSVSLAWSPDASVRANLNVLARNGAIKTVVGVAIDAEGNLPEAFVLKGSGVPEYDAEALRAFKASFPFFPPPKSILSLDGRADDVLHLSAEFTYYL